MKLTEQEFIEKYGDVGVTFSSYYKYTFHFEGKVDETKAISLSVGGSSGDIYKLDVEADFKYSVKQLGFSYAEVKEDGKVVDECNNWY
jgi:hypothetical protein